MRKTLAPRSIWVLAALLGTLLATGCAEMPQGPARLGDLNGVAVPAQARLVLDGARPSTTGQRGTEWVELRAFDRDFVNERHHLRRDYAIAPGTHRLTLRYMFSVDPGQGVTEAALAQVRQEHATRQFEQTISMNAKPGGSYTVKFATNPEVSTTAQDSAFARTVTSIKVRYWVEDSRTGETVSH